MVLHALITSQLLRAALVGHAPLTTLSDQQEIVWVLIWTVVGGLLGLTGRSLWRFALILITGPLLLGVTSYICFIEGWWIPVVAPALA